ncbi:helix-turn-helix transcriptional regulator [Butyricicoccus sp. MSJd-7]|uniref:Helix-turn-helix transcriptional regulator n=2 Tax=Butyricicoccus intestinisimiae TaxID=2841509 RepID=A0ABS6EP63_9FIRM|nr:helix-turn-helix transcriptional regulator [Butyricicoccus intestinisimiae]
MVQRLRKICAAKGISVYAAARKANISVSTLNELLNEKTRPQLYTLYKICNALDIRIVDLFDDNASINKQDRQINHMIVEYQYLPKWKQKLVEQYIEMVAQYERRLK